MGRDKPIRSLKCKFCNSQFTTFNIRALYCSTLCANKASKRRVKERQQKELENKQLQSNKIELSQKEFLSINDTATLIGVSRSTVYRYINTGELKASRIGKRILLKASDLDLLFHENLIEIKIAYNPSPNDLTDYYSLDDIFQKFTISKSWLYKLIKDNNIQNVTHNGRNFYKKEDINTICSDKKNRDLSHFITIEEIAKDYNLTIDSTYTFLSREKIKSTKIGSKAYYSRNEVRKARGDTSSLETDYYSTEEVMSKYNLSRSSLYNLIRYHNIPKIKNGKFIYIDKIALDHLF